MNRIIKKLSISKNELIPFFDSAKAIKDLNAVENQLS